MFSKKYILSLDQGTTSSRAILFDRQGIISTQAQKEFNQIFPEPGWVEHDPEEIWESQRTVTKEVITRAGINAQDISSIGISNQRETTVVWNRITGEPVYNAIVWQDRRTAETCNSLSKQGWKEKVREKTGLVIDAYFSATKVAWILDHIESARELAEKGDLCMGTVDSWLVWKLTGGKSHVTDITNASRTMLYNIYTDQWDEELLGLFNIPYSMLPEVKESSGFFATTTVEATGFELPITGIAGDQQAALFGQLCFEPGMVKNTYGTGCFLVMNLGSKPLISKNNLITTVAWKLNGKITYALEGSIFIAGAVIQWLRDELGIIQIAAETEFLAETVGDNGGVYLVPAFVGLGAPHWDQYARGTIVGITRGTGREHIIRAALESIAYQVEDVVTAMKEDSGSEIKELRVDGGASVNNFLMQFQADILNTIVTRPGIMETTALGAAYLAGVASGFWGSIDELREQWQAHRSYYPSMEPDLRNSLLKNWHKAVERAKGWADEGEDG